MGDRKKLIEGLAKAIYTANPGRIPWENLSADVQNWVRRQAFAALNFIETECEQDDAA